jgi:hypothetical protein
MQTGLYASNAEFDGDLIRNIPGIRSSQDLFDDLGSDAVDRAVAIAAEGRERIPTDTAIVTRPFDYGTVISRSFDSAHWQATRFSDGTSYGVWYGSLELATTVAETAHHWRRFVLDSFSALDREIRTDRRICDVRCQALLIDLRGRERDHPALVRRDSYEFTHKVGRFLHGQDVNGLLVQSARWDGINAAVFRAQRLSEVREKCFLTYRLNAVRDTFVAERTRGRAWLRLKPSSLV